MAGFGGVAEYGITVRWDKNFLKVLRLLLERRQPFALFGGVRFGGTVTAEDAFAMGFDHVALAIGAGRPTVLDLPNGLARGVRTASDFLMALQLTGAAKTDSIANMQLRLPVVVVGGGLTAIDTATESLAYYPLQVEKFLQRYELLAREHGEAAARIAWTDEERAVADEFLAHARAMRAERVRAAAEEREPRVLELLQAWGGVTIAYRRRLIDSPSYTLNHEEVAEGAGGGHALRRGAHAARDRDSTRTATPARCSVSVQQRGEDGKWTEAAPGRAAGEDDPDRGRHAAQYGARARGRRDTSGSTAATSRPCDEAGNPVTPEKAISKPERRARAARMGKERTRPDGRCMSYFGDVHPSYFGNVVKAIGSAKQGYPVVEPRAGASGARPPRESDAGFLARLNDELRATVHEVERLTPMIVEVVVRAPLAARRFRPGQFYRLQNFETLAPAGEGTRLAMEGLALTGAWVDREQGLISTIVLEMGGSSDLCLLLKPGEPVVLMGPTGTPTEIPSGRDRGARRRRARQRGAVLDRAGDAPAGNRVLYFAAYKHMIDRYKIAEIEAASDVGGVVLRRGARVHARPPAGQDLRRQHRAGHARLRERRARRAADPVPGRRPHHRDRLRPHDGGRRARARTTC